MNKEQLENRLNNLDYKRLKGEVTIVNDLKDAEDKPLVEKMRVVGVSKADMMTKLADAVDQINEKHGENAVPDTVIVLYNEVYTADESPLDKKAEKKSKGSGKGSPTGTKKDEYGTRPGTLAHTFVQMCKQTPMTMKDAKAADWNPKKYSFNDTLRRLTGEGKAEVSEEGVITIK